MPETEYRIVAITKDDVETLTEAENLPSSVFIALPYKRDVLPTIRYMVQSFLDAGLEYCLIDDDRRTLSEACRYLLVRRLKNILPPTTLIREEEC